MVVVQRLWREQAAQREMGLLATLQWQFADLQRRTGVHCDLDHENGDCGVGLNAWQRLELFRIVQECVMAATHNNGCERFHVALRGDGGTFYMTFRPTCVGTGPERDAQGSARSLPARMCNVVAVCDAATLTFCVAQIDRKADPAHSMGAYLQAPSPQNAR